MSYAVGSLVKARGREWVVLPESDDELLVLRPLGGSEDEIAGVYVPLEPVAPAQFPLPQVPADLGDHRSCSLLRDAVRLGFRSSAGPFRCFGKIAVEPRPYQLVPLLMALKLDPVRLLIADDVGIGKTVEASLIARELLDRGEAKGLAVLCPPHLAEQWQAELHEKFHIDAALVLPGTAARLERECGPGESLFDRYRQVVVSLDFIKTDRRRDDFLRACPDLVIVDEAHTCASGGQGRSRHQRHQLLKGLAADEGRHLILVTATPHSGDEEAFRSLLALLERRFAALPADLTGSDNAHHRRELAEHFVQRRRGDIRSYLSEQTNFPSREDREESYRLGPAYRDLFEQVLAYTREIVKEEGLDRRHQRVRWWSALALLRSLASSPAAAVATLEARASTVETEGEAEVDEIGRRTVLDLTEDEPGVTSDAVPGSDFASDDESPENGRTRRRLRAFATAAAQLAGEQDAKLIKAVSLIQNLLADGYNPIVFCRFIPTAEYLADELRRRLRGGVPVTAVTGTLPPEEREARILELPTDGPRVLVATDCLSEGINLQDRFDAVFHYDLSWNPTRHEQREGRVDRFGQPRDTVRVLTYYGLDNQIDGIVLEVLLRKHKTIRSSLGISVPVPVDTNAVVEAIFEGLLLRKPQGATAAQAEQLLLLDLKPTKDQLFAAWDRVSEKERRSRTLFAQESIKVDEVERELKAERNAIGGPAEVAAFVRRLIEGHGGRVTTAPGCRAMTIDYREVPVALRDALDALGLAGKDGRLRVACDLPAPEGTMYVSRTHPLVETLATYTLDTALDPVMRSLARRCGVIRTRAVSIRTTLLLLRLRYHIVTSVGGRELPLLAEDCQLVAFTGAPSEAKWLPLEEVEPLLAAEPSGNVSPDFAAGFVGEVTDGFAYLTPHLEQVARERGAALLEAHRRVRTASRRTGVTYRVDPQLPVDVLGLYVLLPQPGGSQR